MNGRPLRPSQYGIATLELVLILPLMLLFMVGMVYFGRYFTYYSAAHKAAHDAARYLSTVSRHEMKTPLSGSAQTAPVLLAQNMVQQEIAGLHPGPLPVATGITCQPSLCAGLALPETVKVVVQMRVTDELFAPFSSSFLGDEGLLLQADVTMLYVGQ